MGAGDRAPCTPPELLTQGRSAHPFTSAARGAGVGHASEPHDIGNVRGPGDQSEPGHPNTAMADDIPSYNGREGDRNKERGNGQCEPVSRGRRRSRTAEEGMHRAQSFAARPHSWLAAHVAGFSPGQRWADLLRAPRTPGVVSTTAANLPRRPWCAPLNALRQRRPRCGPHSNLREMMAPVVVSVCAFPCQGSH